MEEILLEGVQKDWLDNFSIKNFDENIAIRNQGQFSINDCINKKSSPDKKNIFNALKLFSPKDTNVLIIGQDPYPDKEKAHGLAFSHKDGYEKIDASLLNIFKAIQAYKKNTTFEKLTKKQINELNNRTLWNTNLESWAKKKGVLLLNTALTYEKYEFYNKDNLSEKDQKFVENEQNKLIRKHIGVWKPFFQNIIQILLKSSDKKLVIFLWGDKAKKAFYGSLSKNKKLIISRHLLIFESNHPSNQSINRGGNFPILAPGHFKACDEFLGKNIWKNFPENNN